MIEKEILSSGKELELMRVCPECSDRGFIEKVQNVWGVPGTYMFKCNCGCLWRCTTRAAKEKEKEMNADMEALKNIIDEMNESWLSRVFKL